MPIDLTDEEVMLAVRDGDVGKLGVLFERYHARLFGFFCRMNGSRTVSEDLVQETFFRILKYRDTFRRDCSFTKWMYQIARNARLQYFKKHSVEGEIPGNVADGSGLDSNPCRQIESEQAVAILAHAMQALSDEKRELLVLAWYQEMKYDQIAELLGVEAGTVKVRVHRAVRELRDMYRKVSGGKASWNARKSETNLRTI